MVDPRMSEVVRRAWYYNIVSIEDGIVELYLSDPFRCLPLCLLLTLSLNISRIC